MKPTVLIVDDEKNIREGLRAALEDRYETFVAKDAAEAARLMQDVPPDAVLTTSAWPARTAWRSSTARSSSRTSRSAS